MTHGLLTRWNTAWQEKQSVFAFAHGKVGGVLYWGTFSCKGGGGTAESPHEKRNNSEYNVREAKIQF